MNKKAFILGATSSLGTVFCRELALNGWDLILSGRNFYELKVLASDISIRYNVKCDTIVVDLNDKNFSPKKILKKAGNFNNFFVFAGTLAPQDGSYSFEGINSNVRVNFLSIVQLIETSLEILVKNKNSKLLFISSVAGDRGRKSNYIYGSSKAAINEYSSGLRNKLTKHGIHVMTVKLGFVDTPMTYGKVNNLISSRTYASKKIFKALINNKDIVYIPFFWRYIMMIIKLIPENIFKRLDL